MAETPKAVEDCHDLLLWMIPQLDKFPRSRRFTLGERIESGLLEVLEALTAAAYGQDKRIWLDQANRRINSVRHLWRLAYELRVIPARQYEHGSHVGWNKPAQAQRRASVSGISAVCRKRRFSLTLEPAYSGLPGLECKIYLALGGQDESCTPVHWIQSSYFWFHLYKPPSLPILKRRNRFRSIES